MNPGNKKAPAPVTTLEGHGEQLSFLPPVPFCPTWPTKGTLPDRALAMFLNGELLATPDFEAVTESWRLAAVVHSLRDGNWPVEGVSITSPTQTDPHRVIKAYYLPGKYVSQALALQNGGAA